MEKKTPRKLRRLTVESPPDLSFLSGKKATHTTLNPSKTVMKNRAIRERAAFHKVVSSQAYKKRINKKIDQFFWTKRHEINEFMDYVNQLSDKVAAMFLLEIRDLNYYLYLVGTTFRVTGNKGYQRLFTSNRKKAKQELLDYFKNKPEFFGELLPYHFKARYMVESEPLLRNHLDKNKDPNPDMVKGIFECFKAFDSKGIEKYLNHRSNFVKMHAAMYLLEKGKGEKFWNEITKTYNKLNNQNRQQVLDKMYNLDHPKKEVFLRRVYRAGTSENKELALILLQKIDPKKYNKMYHAWLENRIKQVEVEKRKFYRTEFKKTGGKTILLGGKFWGNVVVKVINEKQLSLWIKALEAKEFWESKGFDYVPIEPIAKDKNGNYRVYKTKNGQYRVFTELLGTSVYDFTLFSRNWNKYFDHFARQRIKIQEALEELGVFHGHVHGGNMCLGIKKGKLDIEGAFMPKIYFIDFDLAMLTTDAKALAGALY